MLLDEGLLGNAIDQCLSVYSKNIFPEVILKVDFDISLHRSSFEGKLGHNDVTRSHHKVHRCH